nr:uncharacterized protein LOC112079873 [Salvelinus alpinus]
MKTEAIKKSADFIFGEVKTLKSDMKNVEVICQENEKKVAELELKVNEVERYQCRWNLRLHGIPEQAGEDIKCKVVNICGTVIPESKAKLQENVDIVHRLGRLNDQDKRPRSTIIRFTYTGSSLEDCDMKKGFQYSLYNKKWTKCMKRAKGVFCKIKKEMVGRRFQNHLTFVKNELKMFKRNLSPELPEGFEKPSYNTIGIKTDVILISSVLFLHSDELTVICQRELKSNLKKKFQCVFEGIAKQGNPTLLNKIYTELYITEGGTGEVNNEHELRQIETTTRKQARPETPIKCNDIFKPLTGQDKLIRTVLTKGVAGIGKTVSVQKFILDWADGKANQDVQFVFSFPFRELNLMKEDKHTFIELLNHFSMETKQSRISNYNKYKVLFIFDGLDECRLPLDFQKNKICWDVTESTSVDVLLTNLIGSF